MYVVLSPPRVVVQFRVALYRQAFTLPEGPEGFLSGWHRPPSGGPAGMAQTGACIGKRGSAEPWRPSGAEFLCEGLEVATPMGLAFEGDSSGGFYVTKRMLKMFQK